MTLLAVRQKFLELSGRDDLVVRATGANSGADWYINRGQEMLDRMLPFEKSRAKAFMPVQVGEHLLILERCRFVEQVDFHAADGSGSKELDQARERWLQYNDEDKVTQAINIITNGTFDSDLSSWTLETALGWIWEDGAAKHDYAVGGYISQDATATQFLSDPAGASIPFAAFFTIRDFLGTASQQVEVTCGGSSIIVATNGRHKMAGSIGALGATLKFDPTATWSGKIDDVVLLLNHTDAHNGTVAYWTPVCVRPAPSQQNWLSGSFRQYYKWADTVMGQGVHLKQGVVLWPPTDAAGLVEVTGHFYSRTLVSDTDTTYWTEAVPDLLVEAALHRLEVGYRNVTGADGWMRDIRGRMLELDDEVVMQSLQGIDGFKEY